MNHLFSINQQSAISNQASKGTNERGVVGMDE